MGIQLYGPFLQQHFFLIAHLFGLDIQSQRQDMRLKDTIHGR